MPAELILTKSDFRAFLEAPRHLWALKHQIPLSEADGMQQLRILGGQEIETPAREYFRQVVLPQHPGARLRWQHTVQDGPYLARADAVLQRPDGRWVLCEVKSAVNITKEHFYDLAFQALIVRTRIPVSAFWLLHPDKDYRRRGELDLRACFTIQDVTAEVEALLPEVEHLRPQALAAARVESPRDLAPCAHPKECPCPQVCHPDLPAFSIYDIPNLRSGREELRAAGILAAADIPEDFPLNPTQRLVARCARSGEPHLDRSALRGLLDAYRFPLWFLDYETFSWPVPLFDGYRPHQPAVFQYSLHMLESPEAPLRHTGWISTAPGDPALPLLEHLAAELGESGTVLTWNKRYEISRNNEMAELHPAYAAFLRGLNARVEDLGDFASRGFYLHPGFKGSWSIKVVLPVMVPELSYQDLEIQDGGAASLAGWQIATGRLSGAERQARIRALERYCELDTLAMVEIYRRLRAMV